MATNVQNASAIMDALADYRGVSALSAARKIEIAEKLTGNTDGTNEEKAGDFLNAVFSMVRYTVRKHAESAQRNANEASVTQAGDDAIADL